MVPIQPVHLLRFLRWRRLSLPHGMSHSFYMSWEDALWQLLSHYEIKNGAVALVPSFFCGDVIKNMEAHGLTVQSYPVNASFQTNPTVFRRHLSKFKPEIVIIFHAVGITNQLFSAADQWLSALGNKTILIEDCVHRIVNPRKINFLTERHFVIDSLRKVVPIQGSNLYARGGILPPTTKNNFQTILYQIQVVGWWLLFQVCLWCASKSLSVSNKRWWNSQAERAMVKGYAVIGDSKVGANGWWLFKQLAAHLDVDRIAVGKRRQVQIYKKKLQRHSRINNYFSITFGSQDESELRGFPLGLTLPTAEQVLNSLRNYGLLVRFELADSQWSNDQKVVYLPLGPHLSDSEVNWVAVTVLQAAQSTL